MLTPSPAVSTTQGNEALELICMHSFSSASEGVADWDSCEEEEKGAEAVESEGVGRRRKRMWYQWARRGRWV